MADNIVGGLFGVSPDMYRRATQERDYAQAMRAGSMAATPGTMMSPSLAPIYAEATQQGQLIGQGVGALLGAQDPELQRISQIQQLSSQFDLTTAAGMRDFARALQPIAPNESMMAAKRADELEQAGLTRQKTQGDIQRTQGLISREDIAASQNEQLRAELSAAVQRKAPPEEIKMIAAKYGSADKILQILSQEETRADALAERRNRVAVAAAGKPPKEDKPLPAGTVKEIATAERINNTLNRTNTTLDKYITEVDENKIEFNLGKNIAGWVQRGTGKQDPNTLKQVSLKKFLENERNNILLAAKGTQTEGDANRAMSQIFDRTDWTSNVAVSQALSDLKEYKNSQIDSNNVFMSSLRGGGLPTTPTAAPAPTPKATPQAKDYSADYAKYQAKYKDKAVSYEAYVATRTGKQ